MNEFLNDPVALGAVIFAVLLNIAAIGLKWQVGEKKRASPSERTSSQQA